MQYIDNIPVFGEHEANTLEQARLCARSADHFALMADGHLGYGVPIGGVIASESRISPTAVGFDIACGNKAVRLDMPAAELRSNVERVMDDIWRTLSFGVGRKNAERNSDSPFVSEAHAGWTTEAARPLRQKANAQLGTIGSGNHYVDLFTDEQDRVWLGVHFGSRGLGHGIATWFLKAAGAKDGMMVDPVFLEVSSDLGAQYIAAMQLGGAYAYAGRDWVCSRVARLLGAQILEEVHNHHNFAWLEEHEGKQLWVCRKGATRRFRDSAASWVARWASSPSFWKALHLTSRPPRVAKSTPSRRLRSTPPFTVRDGSWDESRPWVFAIGRRVRSSARVW